LRRRFAQTHARAVEQVEAALRAQAAGDLAGALEAYEMAAALAPRDAAIQQAHAELRRTAVAKVAEAAEKQAQLEERFGHWAEAASSWQRVAAARPNDPQVRERVLAALAKAKERAGG